MKVDIITPDFGKIYDISKFDVIKGKKFSIQTDLTTPTRWFSDNDPVLSIAISDTAYSAEVEATAIGESSILILGLDKAVLKTIEIKVIEKIEIPAATLGLTADAPVSKV